MVQVLFHGGCHECTRQEEEGIDYCVKCRYFQADWSLPDLNNKEESEVDKIRRKLKMKHNV